MHVFTYGTLQADAVWRRVAGRAFATVEGTAHGYRIRRVRDADYPTMIEWAEDATPGLVHLDVDEAALDRLDRFEGDAYRRLSISVACHDGIARECQAYLLADGHEHLLTDEPWVLEHFLKGEGLKRFCERYEGFRSIE